MVKKQRDSFWMWVQIFTLTNGSSSGLLANYLFLVHIKGIFNIIYIFLFFFWLTLYPTHIRVGSREPLYLVLRHSAYIKTLPLPNCRRMLEAFISFQAVIGIHLSNKHLKKKNKCPPFTEISNLIV